MSLRISPAVARPPLSRSRRVAEAQLPRPAARNLRAEDTFSPAPVARAPAPVSAALSTLTPDDQRRYAELYASFADQPEVQAALGQLLEAGKLGQPDTQGHTTLENLAQLAQTPTAITGEGGAPVDTRSLVAQTIQAIAAPDAAIAQGHSNTCGATTIEYLLAQDQPSEFVRLTQGLLGPGEVTLRGGSTLSRVPDSVSDDGRGRTALDRVLQSALMGYDGGLRGEYSCQTDRFARPVPPIDPSDLGSGLSGLVRGAVAKVVNAAIQSVGADHGLGENDVATLYRDVLGEDAHVVGDIGDTGLLMPERVTVPTGGVGFGGVHLPDVTIPVPGDSHGEVVDAVRSAVASGRAVPVDVITAEGFQSSEGVYTDNPIDRSQVGYAEMMDSHQILITGIEDGVVTYRNPWGFTAQMSLEELESRLTDAVLPG